MTIDRQQASTLEKLDDGVDTFNEPIEETTNTRTPRYDNTGDALKGVATTVGGIASGAVSATLGLPTDIVGLFKGLKEAVSAEDGKRLDAFSEGFTEFSKENLGSQYYRDVFDTFVDSLDVDPRLKEDAKSGFSAGEFITPPIAGGSAVKAVTKIDKIRDGLARSEAMAIKSKENVTRKIDEIGKEFNDKAPKTYTRSEIMAMTAKREPSPVRQMTEAEKKAQEFNFEKNFNLEDSKLRGTMAKGMQDIAERTAAVTTNIEKTGYYDAYPRGSKFVAPRSGKEYTVIGYRASSVGVKGKKTLTNLHSKRTELIESGELPKERKYFDGNDPKISANEDIYDDRFYQPKIIMKDKDGKIELFNYDFILHQDNRKKQLLNKVMPDSKSPKVNIKFKRGGLMTRA